MPVTLAEFPLLPDAMPKHLHPVLTILLAGSLSVLPILTGCSDRGGIEALNAAKAHLAAERRTEAILEFKNALQADGSLSEARLLLGQALLANEDPAGAVVELEKALAAGFPPETVLPALARALDQAQRPEKVLALAPDAAIVSPEANADLRVTRARAHAALGALSAAEHELAQALAAAPGDRRALTLQARLTAAQGEDAKALQQIRGVLAAHPDDADARVLEGDLLQRVSGDRAAATAAYRAAVQADPRHLAAAAALVLLLVEGDDMAAAEVELNRLKQVRPRHAQTLYLDALLAHVKGENRTALERSRQLLAVAPDNPQVLQLAGAAALSVGQMEQAVGHLGKLVKQLPDFKPGRLLLARAHLRSGRPDQVLAITQPLLVDPDVDPRALSIAAQAHLLKGENVEADRLLRRAAKAKHNTSRTALAMAQIGSGEVSAGMSRLADLARDDPGTTADMALVVARLMQRDAAGALTALDGLERKQPGQPSHLFLRGQILARQGDLNGARKLYLSALEISPKFFAAVDALAGLDLQTGRPQDARDRFDRLLQADPGHALALQALAQLDEDAGRPKSEVAGLLQRAVRASPADVAIRRRLVGYHLRKGDADLALTAAQDAVAALPDEPSALESLALAQSAAGDMKQAVASFSKLVAMLPKSADAYLGLAKVHLQTDEPSKAVSAIRHAVELADGAPETLQRSAALYLLAGQPDLAAQLARQLQAKVTTQAVGLELAGDIEASRKAWASAARSYRDALKLQPVTRVARSLHQALYQADVNAARSFVDSWVRQHPKDVEFLFSVGGFALAARDFATAEAAYLMVLKTHPEHPFALNNLAWAMHALGKPGAVERAQRANELMPDVPGLMDTWAMLLAEDGRVGQALALQTRAVELDPGKPSLSLTLAKILVKMGDKTRARAELERLQALGQRFEDHKEVDALLAGI